MCFFPPLQHNILNILPGRFQCLQNAMVCRVRPWHYFGAQLFSASRSAALAVRPRNYTIFFLVLEHANRTRDRVGGAFSRQLLSSASMTLLSVGSRYVLLAFSSRIFRITVVVSAWQHCVLPILQLLALSCRAFLLFWNSFVHLSDKLYHSL